MRRTLIQLLYSFLYPAFPFPAFQGSYPAVALVFLYSQNGIGGVTTKDQAPYCSGQARERESLREALFVTLYDCWYEELPAERLM